MPQPSDAGPQGRKLTPSMLEGTGVAIERLPALGFVLEQFALALAEATLPLVRDPLAGSFEPPAASSVFAALAERRGRQCAVLRCEELDARVLVVFPADVAEFVVNAVFGGRPRAPLEGAAEAPPPLTIVETHLVREFAQILAVALSRAFAPLAALAFSLEGVRTLADPHVLGRRDAPAAVARVALKGAAGVCACEAIFPGHLLHALRQELAAEPPEPGPAPDPRWARKMEVGVAKARMQVTAILETFEMTLGEVANFRKGRVIALPGSGLGKVRLECGGRGVFWGALARGEGRYAITLERPVEADAPASDLAR